MGARRSRVYAARRRLLSLPEDPPLDAYTAAELAGDSTVADRFLVLHGLQSTSTRLQ